MKTFKHWLLLALIVCVPAALEAQTKRNPYIGYLFPGGGKQGTVFEIIVGGQFLRGAKNVYVSGEGVTASIVKHYRPRRNIQREQRLILQKKLREVSEKRLAEMPEKDRPPEIIRRLRASAINEKKRIAREAKKKKEDEKKNAAAKKVPVVNKNATGKKPGKNKRNNLTGMPEHPLLRDIENKSLKELYHITDELLNFRNRRKRQRNSQLGEMVVVKVTIDRNAAPGDRVLRLGSSRQGMTNPMCFQVGTLPEAREQEPNDPKNLAARYLPKEEPRELPVLMNGQIMPGDVDRFTFRAKKGQQLVIETSARRLVPFLADAVPGWFQATLALYDPKGNEVAFADDYLFNPDPVLFYQVPEDGVYELEIRDSIYRGREDFVYRIAVGQLPFITQAFPLGGRAGAKAITAIDGWNLPNKRMRLDTRSGDDVVRQTNLHKKKLQSNEVTYAVDTLPEYKEAEPNNDIKNAQRITMPRIVNGRIASPGDVDVFRINGRAGDEVVAEVYGRRLHSPIDSLLRLTDASGKILEWNDDYVKKEGHLHTDMGYLTHHADSFLSARLPTSGIYYVHVADTQNHGGEAYGYRLRISNPLPDFSLQMTPSSLSMLAGAAKPFTVHVLRKDGFKGEIELALKDAPAGFLLSGARIPSNRNSIRMTLTAPGKAPAKPFVLQLEGRAYIDGKAISRPVVPSDNVMQAFLWRHLAPSQELIVTVTRRRWSPPLLTPSGRGPVRVSAGSVAMVTLNSPRRLWKPVKLKITEPIKGITLKNVKNMPNGLTFQLEVDPAEVKPGYADNLIVEAFVEVSAGKGGKQIKGGKRVVKNKSKNTKETKKTTKPKKQKTRQYSIGTLPAIPFVVVKPQTANSRQ